MSGITKFAHPDMMAGMMAQQGVPTALPLLYLSAIVEVVGALLLMVGLRARAVALLLFLWLIPVTIIMHAIPGGQMNQIEVLKNLAIMGGLLMIASKGAGGYSIDRG